MTAGDLHFTVTHFRSMGTRYMELGTNPSPPCGRGHVSESTWKKHLLMPIWLDLGTCTCRKIDFPLDPQKSNSQRGQQQLKKGQQSTALWASKFMSASAFACCSTHQGLK